MPAGGSSSGTTTAMIVTMSTENASTRKEISYEMQKIDFEQGGYIIPCFVDSLDAYSSNLTGYVRGKVGEPLGNFNFEDYSFLS